MLIKAAVMSISMNVIPFNEDTSAASGRDEDAISATRDFIPHQLNIVTLLDHHTSCILSIRLTRDAIVTRIRDTSLHPGVLNL